MVDEELSPPISPSKLPFSVSGVTPTALEPVVYDLVNDLRQGLNVPAKGLYFRHNGSSGTLVVSLLSSNGAQRIFDLQHSEELGFEQGDGIQIWAVVVAGTVDSIPYTFMAIPGVWTPEELWAVYLTQTGEAVG